MIEPEHRPGSREGEGEVPAGPAARRELLLAALAIALVAAGLYLFIHRLDGCAAWQWTVPVAEFGGGAAIFGYSGFWPVRTLGCLSMICSFPVAAAALLCGGFGP